jgi:uncharacterized protein (TIRG00374 family)
VTRSLAWTLSKYVLGLSLLAYVIAANWAPAGDSPGLSTALQQPINVGAFLLAFACAAISVTTTFVRWYGLVRAQELPFTLRGAMRLGMVSYFFNAVLPGAIGGDIVKAIGLARSQSRRTVAVATVVFDRLIGLWGLIWLVSILGAVFWLLGSETLLSNAGLVAIVRTAWIVLGATIAMWIVLGVLPESRAQRFAGRLNGWGRVGRSLAELWRAVWMYRSRPNAVAAALGLSFVSQSFFVLGFHFAARVFAGNADVPTLTEHSLVVPLGMVVQAVFPAPGGVGGGEFGFGKLYVVLRRPEALGVLGSLTLRMISWALGLIGYAIYLQMKPTLKVDEAEANREP